MSWDEEGIGAGMGDEMLGLRTGMGGDDGYDGYGMGWGGFGGGCGWWLATAADGLLFVGYLFSLYCTALYCRVVVWLAGGSGDEGHGSEHCSALLCTAI